MLMPTEDWVGIYVAVLRRPDPPVELKVMPDFMGGGKAAVTWKPAPLAVETMAFHLYRKDGNSAPIHLAQVPVRAEDKSGEYRMLDTRPNLNASVSTYFVTAEEWSGLESDTTSNAVEVSLVLGDGHKVVDRPALTKFDTVAPPAITGFTAIREEPGQYRLKWDQSPASDLRYYNVYFSQAGGPEISQKRLIVSPLKGMTSYLDWSAPTEGGAFYAITAVDRQGNESPPAFVDVK
jgi:hypothetical protein